jgi:hypothetical protein
VGAFRWQPSLSESLRVLLGFWPNRLCRPLARRHSAKGRRRATDVGTLKTFIKHSPLRERSAAAHAHHTENLRIQSSISGSVLGRSRCLCSPGHNHLLYRAIENILLGKRKQCTKHLAHEYQTPDNVKRNIRKHITKHNAQKHVTKHQKT